MDDLFSYSSSNKPEDPTNLENIVVKKKSKKAGKEQITLLTKNINNTIWLSVSEAAKIGGVQAKTIRRAIVSKVLKYKIVGNRYLIDLTSLIHYLHTKTKLKNKFNTHGIGQYIERWTE